jgi:hypothetical protein
MTTCNCMQVGRVHVPTSDRRPALLGAWAVVSKALQIRITGAVFAMISALSVV